MADLLRILVATDMHLGYAEKDQIRSEDSMESFEEILKLAKKEKVDMLLLGGDLFHDNKPTRKTLHRCMELLRHYCMGDQPCEMEIVSDQKKNFHVDGKYDWKVNYEDPNYNVGIPVFSIHGNHDDPTGDGALSALDLLSTANFINYFGRSRKIDDVQVSPILIRKGDIQLALYGLGNIRDERLHRTFVEKKVKMLRPREDPDSWFNLLVLHQNRVKHGATNYIPEEFVPKFIDMVVWGHEHDCQVGAIGDPGEVERPYIVQPGSSIATSLSKGEAERKHVLLVEINSEKQFRMISRPLRTVRPFIFRDIELTDELTQADVERNENAVEEKLEQVIREMIDESKEQASTKAPLLRLRVEYTGFETINTQRFGQRFVGEVANPKDLLLFHRRRQGVTGSRKKDDGSAASATEPHEPDAIDVPEVLDLVDAVLQEQPLGVLRRDFFNRAVEDCVGPKKDKDSIPHSVQFQVDRATDTLVSRGKDTELDEEAIMTEVMKFGVADAEDDYDKAQSAWQTGRYKASAVDDDFDSLDDDDAGPAAPAPAARKPAAKSKAATKAATAKGKAKAAPKEPAKSRKKAPAKAKAAPLEMASTSRGRKRKPVTYTMPSSDEAEAEEEAFVPEDDDSDGFQGSDPDVMVVDDDEEDEKPPTPPPTKSKRVIPGRSKRQRR
eukprot:m.455897 g.455897  ORF g.455897 m.455897 type:complete len:668 (-) comp20957_c0_seq1:227-2230(-)